MQRFVKWHGIIIPCIRCGSDSRQSSSIKIFYINIKNPKVKTGLVRLVKIYTREMH